MSGYAWIVLMPVLLSAETPPRTASGPILSFTASTANMAGAAESVRIDILRWSAEAERDRLMSAWNRKGGAGAALAAALKETATVGYLWSSSEVAGYALRYAGKVTGEDGLERIILLTHRRLGAMNDWWKPSGGATPAAYDFSVIELRVNAQGEGEGKVSLTGKVASDPAARMVALENYDALAVVLTNVKKRRTP